MNTNYSIAVWLISHSDLSEKQIAEFCNVSMLDIKTIIQNKHMTRAEINPIKIGLLTEEEIIRCEKDESASLQKKEINMVAKKVRQKQDVPHNDKLSAILWLLKRTELNHDDICKLISVDKSLVDAISKRDPLKIPNIKPTSPISLNICSNEELKSITNGG